MTFPPLAQPQTNMQASLKTNPNYRVDFIKWPHGLHVSITDHNSVKPTSKNITVKEFEENYVVITALPDDKKGVN